MMRPKKGKEKREKLSRESIQKAKKIFSYLKPYRGTFAIGWVFLVLSSSIGLLFPLLMGQLLGSGSEEPSRMANSLEKINVDNVNSVAFALFIMFAAQALFGFFRIIIFTQVTENTLRDVRKDAFSRLIYMPMDFFNKNKVGELTSRMASDITQVQDTLRTTIPEFFRQIVIILGGVSFLLYLSWKLSLIMLATVPVMAIVAVLFGRFIRRLSREAQDEAAASNVIIEESLTGISNVKSFTNELFMIGKYEKAVKNIRNLNIKSGLWRGVFVSFIIFALFGAIVFIVWQGLLMTQGPNPELASKDFFSFIMFTIMMGASFGSVPDLYANIQKAIGATENLMTILEEQNEIELHTGEETPQITGEVAFEDVHFAYPQRKDIEVLKGISFDVDRNQQIALVGSSGAGKSTIASLLLHFYDVTGGTIRFNGVPMNEIATDHLRKHLSIVPQEVILFAGTVKENIAFGNLEASDEAIIEAAKKANAWEFIDRFPEKLETQVGDRGIQLSGGQKQRIAIARAILNDPEILILDEATSSLDSESEKLVQDALETLMKGRTSFVIAHRLSTIKKADKILVLENGKIVESGTHEELAALNGSYSGFLQFQEF
jgi:ABC-type multidrug transport system fused ATPase/permease subunit